MTEKARTIIRHVAELYSFGTEHKTVDEMIQINYEKLLDKENVWEDAFVNYEVDDVLDAVDNYWRWKSDKSRPSVAQILSLIKTNKEVKPINNGKKTMERHFCIENLFFERDRATGRLQYNLPTYKKAVDKIMKEMMGEWEEKNGKIEHEDEAIQLNMRYKKAMELGYFNYFDEILEKVANNC